MRYPLVAVRGAGDLASGVIHRLWRAGFAVVVSELAEPTALRRTVAFAEAVGEGEATVEDVTARRIEGLDEIQTTLAQGKVPLLVDPGGELFGRLRPLVLIEATLAKQNRGISLSSAPIVIALGPGFEAGRDVHAVVETNRGHNLGRVYRQGSAEPNTGVPGLIAGYGIERLLRAPGEGRLYGVRVIGERVEASELIARVRTEGGSVELEVRAEISGILRGLVRDGLRVSSGMKIGDIDPRANREHCFSISDKARAVAGGVLEAVLYFLSQ